MFYACFIYKLTKFIFLKLQCTACKEKFIAKSRREKKNKKVLEIKLEM